MVRGFRSETLGNKGWKKVQNNNGAVGVTLPSKWDEIYISVIFGRNKLVTFPFHLLKEQLMADIAIMSAADGTHTYANGASDAVVTISVSETKCYINSYTWNGSVITSECPIVVCYR